MDIVIIIMKIHAHMHAHRHGTEKEMNGFYIRIVKM